jgi:hypothetical protein
MPKIQLALMVQREERMLAADEVRMLAGPSSLLPRRRCLICPWPAGLIGAKRPT